MYVPCHTYVVYSQNVEIGQKRAKNAQNEVFELFKIVRPSN